MAITAVELRRETWPRDGLSNATDGPLMKPEVEQLVRDYAAGKVAWPFRRNTALKTSRPTRQGPRILELLHENLKR
jgi:hypothetical protein